MRTTTRSGTDVDGLTIDTFRPSLNASDPQTSNVAGAFPKEPFPGNTGAADDNVLTIAKARITIPTTATYTFWVQGDDGFRLSIKSTNGSADPPFQRATQGGDDAAARLQMSNPNEIFFENGTGNADTRGIILLQAGTYDLEFNHWEGNGGFYYELSAAVGSFPHGTGGGNFQLVGSATGIQLVAQPSVGTPPGTRIPVSNFTTNGSPVSSVTLTFGSETGRTYKIQASTNLATWTDVETATPASGTGTNTNTVTLAAFPALNGQPSLFFRVIVN